MLQSECRVFAGRLHNAPRFDHLFCDARGSELTIAPALTITNAGN